MRSGVSPRISVIIPVLNEARLLPALLTSLQDDRSRSIEIIVVDGASNDATVSVATPLCDIVCEAARGRAAQMNRGARESNAAVLLFVHADSRLPADFALRIERAIEGESRAWGRFDVQLDARGWVYRVIECAMNWRSRLTGIATGDQCLFVTRKLFDEVGGFPQIPLMEDIALSKRLNKESPPRCILTRVTTSARRWQQHGITKTVLTMWMLRAAYALGVAPSRLHRIYSGKSIK